MKRRQQDPVWTTIRHVLAGVALFAAGVLLTLSFVSPAQVKPELAALAAVPSVGSATAQHVVKLFLSPRCPHCRADLAEHGTVLLDWAKEGRIYLELGVIPLEGAVVEEDAALYCIEAVHGFEAYFAAVAGLASHYRGERDRPSLVEDPRVAECVRSGGGARAVTRAMIAADLLGVTGTPTYFIDGKAHVGRISLADLKAALEVEE